MVMMTKQKKIIILIGGLVTLTIIGLLVYGLWLRPQNGPSASDENTSQDGTTNSAPKAKPLTKTEHKEKGAELQAEAEKLIAVNDVDGAVTKLKQSRENYQAAGDEASAETIRVQIKNIASRKNSSEPAARSSKKGAPKSISSDQPVSDDQPEAAQPVQDSSVLRID